MDETLQSLDPMNNLLTPIPGDGAAPLSVEPVLPGTPTLADLQAMEGAQAPFLPATPAVPAMVAAPVATAPVAAIPASVAPVAPVEPATETVTTKERKIMSPESKKAMADYEQSIQKQQEAAAKEVEAQVKVAQEEAKYKAMEADETARIADTYAQEMNQADQAIKLRQESLNSAIAEFANQKPETFWGTKSDGDKVAAAISVGLGSLGQALLGSKENVGMALLNRSMDEFARNQEAEYKRQLKGLENQKLSIDQMFDAKKSLKQNFDAKLLAATEKVKSQYAIAAQQAKMPEIIAKAQKAQADLDARAALQKQNIFKEYATTEKTVATKKAMERLAGNLTPTQRKASLKSAEDLRTAMVKRLEAVTLLKEYTRVLSDPNVDYDKKLATARLAIKPLMDNQEALGESERKVYGAFLENKLANIVSRGIKYAGAGAAGIGTLGGAVGGAMGGAAGAAGGTVALPVLGTATGAAAGTAAGSAAGSAIGAGIGAVGGFLGGAGSAAVEAIMEPGGFTPDVEGFNELAKSTTQRFENNAKFTARVIELVEREGLDIMQANIIARKEQEAQPK